MSRTEIFKEACKNGELKTVQLFLKAKKLDIDINVKDIDIQP